MIEKTIAKRVAIRTLANGHIFKVTAKLTHLSGNAKSHFSVTGEERNPRIRRNNGIVACGCLHDEISRLFPKFRPILAMHLSDDEGAPMHAVDNGWYNMAGALGGAGQQYHRGNSDMQCKLRADQLDPSKPWLTTEYRKPTADECLSMWADHVRVSFADALSYKLEIMRAVGPLAEPIIATGQQWDAAFGPIVYEQPYDGDPGANAIKRVITKAFASCEARHAEIVNSMRDRWRAEAAAAIAFLQERPAE